MDAVAHAVESYVTTRSNPVSRTFAREAWRLLQADLPAVLADPADLGAWGRMLLGAHFAGVSIEQSMLGAAHACANPLTARFPIPHGSAVALMLPHVVRFNAAEVARPYAELAGSPTALEQRLRELREAAGLPGSLRDYGVDRACLAGLASEAAQQWTAAFNPRRVGAPELLGLYEAAY
jgi:alcohol dehydrogenase